MQFESIKKFPVIIQIILALVILGCNERLDSQNGNPDTKLDTTIIAKGLIVPWEILWSPENELWVTERGGKVLKINPETKERKELIEIQVTEEGESGLLGMALHPDFPSTPWVYLVYTYTQASSIKERLTRYTYQQDQLVDEEILIDNIAGNNYHIGARLIFGHDGKLYMTTGDAGNTSLSQNQASLSGKLLRINPDGSVPDDNPIQGSYVWASGLRNSQGLDFSPTGILYSSEHGPQSDDEINILEVGRNYGWPDVKGMCDNPSEADFCSNNNVREPIQVYTPTLALAGIAYYQHSAIPEWNNSLIVTSLKAGKLLILHLDEQGMNVVKTTTFYDNDFGRLRDVCVSTDGRVFIATSNRDGRGSPKSNDDMIIEISR